MNLLSPRWTVGSWLFSGQVEAESELGLWNWNWSARTDKSSEDPFDQETGNFIGDETVRALVTVCVTGVSQQVELLEMILHVKSKCDHSGWCSRGRCSGTQFNANRPRFVLPVSPSVTLFSYDDNFFYVFSWNITILKKSYNFFLQNMKTFFNLYDFFQTFISKLWTVFSQKNNFHWPECFIVDL